MTRNVVAGVLLLVSISVATQLFLRDGDSIIAEARSEGTMSAAVRGARVRESRQQGGSQLVAEPEDVNNESGQMPAPSPRVGTKGPSAKTPFVGDLDVALRVTPDHVVSGMHVQVEMTVTNTSPHRLTNVTPSALRLVGTATSSATSEPRPAVQPVLEPGESASFSSTTTVTGWEGQTYAFSGSASAEWDAIVARRAVSNRGTLLKLEGPGQPKYPDESRTVGASGAAAEDAAGTAAASTVAVSAAVGNPSATLQFVGVNLDGTLTGGVQFGGTLLQDLRILAGWDNVSGGHIQRLDLYLPDGALYQRFSTSFAHAAVETELQVNGSWITQHALFGSWRVELYLDDGRTPIASEVFVLTPG